LSTATIAKTVKLVPIGLYADMARTALATLEAQKRYFRTKFRQDLLIAKDWERRLQRNAEGAISLHNTTPGLFEEPAAEDAGLSRESLHDVLSYLERLSDSAQQLPGLSHDPDIESHRSMMAAVIAFLRRLDQWEGGGN
jgi:hypothetical protein